MKVVKNFIWNAGYQIFGLLVPLITVPYISRVLGPTGVGINSYTNSIVQYFVLLGGLGIDIYGNREIAYNRDSRERMSQIFWEISILRFIAIAIAELAYLAFVLSTHQYRAYYLIQGIALIATALDISWLFMGMENFRVTVLRNALVKIISVVLIFTFVKSPASVGIYIFILVASQALGNLTLWPYLRSIITMVPIKSLHIIRHIRPSVTLLIPQIAIQLYLQLNKTMLGTFSGVEAAGFYDNSDKIIKMVLAVITATGTVLLPHVAHSFAKGDHQAVKRSLITSMHVILVFAFPMAFGLAAVSQPFTILFFGEKFAAVGALMAVEAPVIILIGIGNAVGTQYLLPTNQLRAYTTSVIFGSIVNILLNIPLILAFGTMGAIVSTVISEIAVTGYQVFTIRAQVSPKLLFQEVWKYLFSAFGMYCLVNLSTKFFSTSVSSIVIEALIGVVSYSLLLFMFKPSLLKSYVDSFLSQK